MNDIHLTHWYQKYIYYFGWIMAIWLLFAVVNGISKAIAVLF